MIYKIEDLIDEYKSGGRRNFLFFWGHTPPADGSINSSCFNQWWQSRFIVDGEAYSCAEQFMMSEKAKLFGDESMHKAIMNAKHPKEMKEYGRLIKSFDSSVWESCCYEIVKRGNYAKFEQNPGLLNYLKKTKDYILVEASPVDRIWGIGLAKDAPNVENPLKWRGENLLGFALTEIRDQLMERKAYTGRG